MVINLFLCTLEQCAQDDHISAPCISLAARFHVQISQTACKFHRPRANFDPRVLGEVKDNYRPQGSHQGE